jgi:hypothetical protein
MYTDARTASSASQAAGRGGNAAEIFNAVIHKAHGPFRPFLGMILREQLFPT